MSGDLRALSAEQFAQARKRMEAIVASSSLAQTKATITFDEGYPPLAPTEGNRKLLALYDQASRDVGAGPVTAVDPDRAGAADVSFIAGHVPMILDGVGLMGDGGHTVNETADLSDAAVADQAGRAAAVPAVALGQFDTARRLEPDSMGSDLRCWTHGLTPVPRSRDHSGARCAQTEDRDVVDGQGAAVRVDGVADSVETASSVPGQATDDPSVSAGDPGSRRSCTPRATAYSRLLCWLEICRRGKHLEEVISRVVRVPPRIDLRRVRRVHLLDPDVERRRSAERSDWQRPPGSRSRFRACAVFENRRAGSIQ